jgi:hypothetical protein
MRQREWERACERESKREILKSQCLVYLLYEVTVDGTFVQNLRVCQRETKRASERDSERERESERKREGGCQCIRMRLLGPPLSMGPR